MNFYTQKGKQNENDEMDYLRHFGQRLRETPLLLGWLLVGPFIALWLEARTGMPFNALHIPIQIHNGVTPLTAILGIFSIGYPTGPIWGYLYLRTRSIIPGTLWHAANEFWDLA
jgi:hypothetical protein